MLFTFSIDVQHFSTAVLLLNLHTAANCAFRSWSVWTQGLCWKCASGVWQVVASPLRFLFPAGAIAVPPALPAGVFLGWSCPSNNRCRYKPLWFTWGCAWRTSSTIDWEEYLFANVDVAEMNILPGKFDSKWNRFLKPFRIGF